MMNGDNSNSELD